MRSTGTELLIDSADRLEGVTTVGVDEHVVRHEAFGGLLCAGMMLLMHGRPGAGHRH